MGGQEDDGTGLLLLCRLALRPRRRWSDSPHRRGRILGLIGSRRGGAALAALDHAQAGDVAQVLLIGLGEDMAAGAIGDEVELARARWIGGGLKRGPARIGDRPGR